MGVGGWVGNGVGAGGRGCVRASRVFVVCGVVGGGGARPPPKHASRGRGRESGIGGFRRPGNGKTF